MIMNGRTLDVRNAPIIQLLKESKITSDTISLGQGIPFFPPPNKAKLAMKKAVDNGMADAYSNDQGLLSLREVIVERMKHDYYLSITNDQIQVTAGANQAFINIILTITKPGDEIIIFSPTYFNDVMAIELAGCKPVIVQTKNNSFLPDGELIKKSITKKTKAVVTISPNNPTGKIYPEKLLKEINQICADNNLFHISDEVYEYFIYDEGKHVSPITFDSSIDHTISLYSCSKSFGMSGYRIGYMIVPQYLIDEVLKVQDTIGICAPVPCQYAAIEAIKLGSSYMKGFLTEIERIRNHFIKYLSDIDGINVYLPEGSLYFFIIIKNSRIDSKKLAKQLIDQYQVITIPGKIFDVDFPSLRVSFGNLRFSEAIIGIDRLATGLTHLLR